MIKEGYVRFFEFTNSLTVKSLINIQTLGNDLFYNNTCNYGKMFVESYSWMVRNETDAVKHTDLSTFNNHGTGIPIDIRLFFDIEKMQPGENRKIELILNGKTYYARLNRSRSTTQVTRMFWYKDLSNVFNNMFPNVVNTGKYPDLLFEKISSSCYQIRFNFDKTNDSGNDEAYNLENEVVIETKEGKKIARYTTVYERDSKYRDVVMKRDKWKCQACGFDFEKVYGERGHEFIEVHHLVPLYTRGGETTINLDDLVCLCSNCHRMVHRSKKDVLSLTDLKKLIADNKRN